MKKITKIVFLDASALVKYFLNVGQEKGVGIMQYLIDDIQKDKNFNIVIETLDTFIEETKKILDRKQKKRSIAERHYDTAIAILETPDFIHIPEIGLNKVAVKEKQNKNKHLCHHNNDAKYAEYISIYFKNFKLKNTIPVPVLSDKSLIKYLEKEGFDVVNPELITKEELRDRLQK